MKGEGKGEKEEGESRKEKGESEEGGKSKLINVLITHLVN